MLLKPIALSASTLPMDVLEQDKTNCKKIGPCGLGQKALYLNSFYIDRRYYIPYGSIQRVYKRIAMSKGGFTGKGMFATMSYLVVEYDNGKEKQCNFKFEQNVDLLLAELARIQPKIRLVSARSEQKLAEKAAQEAAAKKQVQLSPKAEALAEELGRFANVLEKADDFDASLQELVCQALTEHSRIIFSGNGYSDEWKEEAARRGLHNFPSTAEALPTYVSDKNIDLVTRHGVFTETEFRARYRIHLDAYNKVVAIEAKTMIDMALHQILPAAMNYSHQLCSGIAAKKAAKISCWAETDIAGQISTAADRLYDHVGSLKETLCQVPAEPEEAALYNRRVVLSYMEEVRRQADILETLTDKSHWPFPTYSDLLFY